MAASDFPPLVVDANILIAASLKESTTRRLLLDPRLRLYAPQHLWQELESKADLICERAGIMRPLLDALLGAVQDRLVTVPEALVRQHVEEARRQLSSGDLDDLPYLAAALAVGGAIWTHDRGIHERTNVPCLTTAAVMSMLHDA